MIQDKKTQITIDEVPLNCIRNKQFFKVTQCTIHNWYCDTNHRERHSLGLVLTSAHTCRRTQGEQGACQRATVGKTAWHAPIPTAHRIHFW